MNFNSFSSKTELTYFFLMKIIKFNRALVFLVLSLVCVSCSNSGSYPSKEADQSKSDKQIISKLDLIQRSFDKGDTNTACDLQLELSKDLMTYEKISPELLNSVQEFKIKCGSHSFMIDFGKDK